MPLPSDDPPNLAEVALREKVRDEVMDELIDRDEILMSRDKRVLALALSFAFALSIIVPLLGLMVGVAVRAYRFGAGQ